jgi:hypothetical protein
VRGLPVDIATSPPRKSKSRHWVVGGHCHLTSY